LVYRRTLFAIIIVVISAVGLVAYAYSLALQSRPSSGANPCAPPSKSTSRYQGNFRGDEYLASNVTFTDIDQSISMPGATFTVVSLSDPSIPQLVNGQCADSNNPYGQASIQVRVDYTDGGAQETLSLNYKGSFSYEQTSAPSTHLHPKVWLVWQPGHDYIILLASLA